MNRIVGCILAVSVLGLTGCYDFGSLSSSYEGGTSDDAGPMSDVDLLVTPQVDALNIDLTNASDGCGDACQPAVVIPRNGLVGEWLFNNNAIDTSGMGNNGIIHGATSVADRFGNPNSAYAFDGKSAYIEVPNSQSLGLTDNFAISVWINVAAYGASRQGIVSKYRADFAAGYDLRISGINAPYNVLDFDEAGFHTTLGSPTAPAPLGWHHILALMDNSTAYVYVDGVLLYIGSPGYKATVTADPLGIGIDYTLASARFFFGTLDNIRIYNRVLTMQEIDALAHEGGI